MRFLKISITELGNKSIPSVAVPRARRPKLINRWAITTHHRAIPHVPVMCREAEIIGPKAQGLRIALGSESRCLLALGD